MEASTFRPGPGKIVVKDVKPVEEVRIADFDPEQEKMVWTPPKESNVRVGLIVTERSANDKISHRPSHRRVIFYTYDMVEIKFADQEYGIVGAQDALGFLP